jgi:hypothetical protein
MFNSVQNKETLTSILLLPSTRHLFQETSKIKKHFLLLLHVKDNLLANILVVACQKIPILSEQKSGALLPNY